MSVPNAYTCLVQLQGLEVSRTLCLPTGANLHDLHHAIQGTFGWWNAHLHRFTEWSGNIPYFYEDLQASDADPTRAMDEHHYPLGLLESRPNRPMIGFDLKPRRAELLYEYDYGDGWRCTVRLEAVQVPSSQFRTCLAAQGVAPCEDSGGPEGYREKVDLYRKHHAETREWFRMMNHQPLARVTPQSVNRQWRAYEAGLAGPREEA
ncbi:hypothetical protein Dxin01_04285 [Deinococcus xinjiangensis]|uniref:Plasmid pRiA4b Orf3-like domain-containing protein n=1 Tax=Deinococcus xinjiangensis TaxID=457454 RepID=A0ABP9VH21_9DEIO